jgi:outer-membrane receptor for ferric coprogen and ferric-rhodotorulic acid
LANTKYTSSPTVQGDSYSGETPRHLFKLWNTYRFTEGPLNKFSIGAGVYAQSDTWRLKPQYRQGGYAIYSAKVGYEFNSHVSADLTVNNLFDKKYYSRAPYLLFAEYGAPRSVMLTVRANY